MRLTFSKQSKALLSLLFVALYVQAQIPTDYYINAKGESGAALKTALYRIVSSHTARSYSQLWEDFKSTDVREDGKIWDMYSNCTNYEPGGSAQGHNYSGEGDSYNREHSFPKSWFNDATPMYTDLFHLYPTDGYVNNRRSNYPFGENNGETYQSNGGFSKVGSCTVSGYSGTCFEPADEYKGDFARTYFYMATAYEDKIASWSSDMLAGNSYPAYADWAITMLLRWAAEDPVSEKEINRNNAVYNIQHNRNPYIDYPGLEQYVWGTKTSEEFDPDNYDGSGGSTDPDPDDKTVEAPTFSPASGIVTEGTEVTITTATTGAYIYYTVNDGEEQVLYPPVTLTINETTSISAYAQMGDYKSETVTAVYTIAGDSPVGENVYTLVTNTSELSEGLNVLIVCPDQDVAMAAQSSDIRSYASVNISTTNTITTEVGGSGEPYCLLLGGHSGAWTFYDVKDYVYLALTSSANKLHTATSAEDKTAQWTISIDADAIATVTNASYTDRSIKYNSTAPRFACYRSGQKSVQLFALNTADQIAEIQTNAKGFVEVYDVQGKFVRRAKNGTEALRNLPCGFYVVNGQKMIVR